MLARYRVTHPGFYIFSLVSLAVLLVLCGILLAGLLFSDQYSRKFKEDIRLLCELSPDSNEKDRETVMDIIEANDGIKEGSVTFVSRDEAFKEMYGVLGEDVGLGDIENPFSDMVEYSIVADSFTRVFVQAQTSELERNEAVVQVHYPDEYFDNVFGIIHTIRTYLIIFILVALGMTGLLIHHIMRLNVVAQRLQIRTMELIGAKPGFIRRPFVRRGVHMGVLAWAIAMGISAIGWYALLGKGMFAAWIFSISGLVGATLLLIISVGVCMISTWIAVTNSLGSTIKQSS